MNTRFNAYIWKCGAECNCAQPVIDVEVWISAACPRGISRVFTGSFRESVTPSELLAMERQLRIACKQHGVNQ